MHVNRFRWRSKLSSAANDEAGVSAPAGPYSGEVAEEPICDFCSSPDLFYAYLAADFTAAEVVIPNAGTFALNSLGAWLACRECTDLIEEEKWEELLDRSFRSFRELHGPEMGMTEADEPTMREFLRDIHAGFRSFRRGRSGSSGEGGETCHGRSRSENRAFVRHLALPRLGGPGFM